jgi:Mg2+/Co2+ transporter CorB
VTLLIVVLAVLVALSGFFSGGEIAFYSVPDTRADALAEEGRRGAKALVRLKSSPDRLLITILIGNNVANIGAASVARDRAALPGSLEGPDRAGGSAGDPHPCRAALE